MASFFERMTVSASGCTVTECSASTYTSPFRPVLPVSSTGLVETRAERGGQDRATDRRKRRSADETGFRTTATTFERQGQGFKCPHLHHPVNSQTLTSTRRE